MPRILLIDDDDLFRRMVRINLEQAGHAVTEARDGREGLALFAAEPADLVLTDLIMPGKEGIETIMELKKSHAALKIIAMSGGGRSGAAGYLHIAKQVGAAKVLAKPFLPQDLLTAINETLGTG